MTKKDINFTGMTPSSIIDNLATSVNVAADIMSIASKYKNNNDTLQIQKDFTEYNIKYNNIVKDKYKQPDILQEQYKVRKNIIDMKCKEYFTILVNKELSKADNIVSMLNRYEDSFTKMRINMELTYRVNKLHNLSDSIAKNIELHHASTYNHVHSHISTLQKITEQLTDIKAIMYARAGHDTSAYGLDHLLNYFSGNPILKSHIQRFITSDAEQDRYTRLEYYKDNIPVIDAHKAGYNNITCMTIINNLNKLATTISTVKDNWYINVSNKYVTNTKANNRVTNVLKSLISQEYADDQGTPYDTVCERINRYNSSMKLLTMVICPMVLKEMEDITSVMNDLRHHLAVNESTNDIIPVKHELAKRHEDDNTYYKFVSNGKKYEALVKGIEYCSNKNNKTLRTCDLLNSKFNRTDSKSISVNPTCINIHINDSIRYINNYSILLNKFNAYIDSTTNTEQPVGTWFTYKPSMNDYHQLASDIASHLHQLDITAKFSGEQYSNVKLISQYRNNLPKQQLVPTKDMSYDKKEDQWKLKRSLDVLSSELIRIHNTKADLLNLLIKLPHSLEDININQVQAMWYCVGDLSQILNHLQYDLSCIEKIYTID